MGAVSDLLKEDHISMHVKPGRNSGAECDFFSVEVTYNTHNHKPSVSKFLRICMNT